MFLILGLCCFKREIWIICESGIYICSHWLQYVCRGWKREVVVFTKETGKLIID